MAKFGEANFIADGRYALEEVCWKVFCLHTDWFLKYLSADWLLVTEELLQRWLFVLWLKLYQFSGCLCPESFTSSLTTCLLKKAGPSLWLLARWKKVLPVVFLYPEEVLTPHSLFIFCWLTACCLLTIVWKQNPFLPTWKSSYKQIIVFLFQSFQAFLIPFHSGHIITLTLDILSFFFFFKVAFEFRPAPVATKHLQRDSNSAVHQSMLASSVSRKRNPCFANESGNCSAHALFRSVVVLGANVKPGKRLASQTAGTEAWDTHTAQD